MATEKEEIILSVQVDQKDAITQLEQLKKGITQTKQEQAELNKAFKAGDITLDEYAQDAVRLESILKKQQSTYNQVQKSVTGVKTQLDKLIDSNKKISKDLGETSKKFQEAASNINVAGVSVGNITTKLASFANPATAAVSVVGLLGAAYARSTVGAKDLEFAQNQLNAAITISTNAFAEFISSSEDGKGIVASFTDEIIRRFNPALATLSKISANNIEALEDLGRDEIEVRDKVNQRLEENQELLTEIQSDQTKYNDKLSKADLIITNIRRNEEELVAVLEDQRELLQFQLALDQQNDALKTAVLQKSKEIGAVERDAEKRVQGVVRLQQNLNEAEEKRLNILKQQQDILNKSNTGVDLTSPTGFTLEQPGTKQVKKERPSVIAEGTLAQIDDAKVLAQAFETIEKGITRNKEREAKNRVKITEVQTGLELSLISDAAGTIAGIFKEGSDLQRTLALFAIGVDTAEAISGLVSASENNPANAYTFGAAGGAQFATGLIRIFANIATASQYLGGAAAGGGDFITKGPTMLMVGDNPGGVERVTVEPISGRGKTVVYPNSNLVAMAGGGTLTTGGNAGLLASAGTTETNQALIMANAMKRMPAPVVGVKEITKIQKRVRVKEQLSRA